MRHQAGQAATQVHSLSNIFKPQRSSDYVPMVKPPMNWVAYSTVSPTLRPTPSCPPVNTSSQSQTIHARIRDVVMKTDGLDECWVMVIITIITTAITIITTHHHRHHHHHHLRCPPNARTPAPVAS
jgi:hypothetical protein